jgi:hypothetical protein
MGMTDPPAGWWLRLPDHVTLIEQDDGTFTLDPGTPAEPLAAAVALLVAHGYTVVPPPAD